MEQEFEGKTAFVTGGAMGIGGAVAELLARRGANVVIVDRAKAEAEALANKLGGKTIAVAANVASSDEVKAAIEETVKRFGGIDIVSNNAGIQRYGTVETTTEAGWDEVMDVNLKSIYLVCHHAIAYLKASKGAVVNMASVQSFATQRNVLAYSTGKHALIGLTRSMALDFAADGVRVNAVAPGSVDTPMLRWAIEQDPNPAALTKTLHAMHPMGRIGKPSEIAEAVCFLASSRASFVTGATLVVDGGLLLPLSGAPAEGKDD